MALTPSGSGRLQVLHAVEEGWGAFCKAPWAFLLFQALAGLVALLISLVMWIGAFSLLGTSKGFDWLLLPSAMAGPFSLIAMQFLLILTIAFHDTSPRLLDLLSIPPSGAWLALIVGVIGYVIVVLWTLVGLTRGAWIALEGRKPAFADFTRWDRRAAARLLGSLILLAVVAAVAGLIASLVGTGLGRLNQALVAIPMIAVAIFYLWLVITQKFLVQVALLGNRRPADSLRSGINVVNPSWWMVLWLAIVEGVIQVIGALFHFGGLVAVVPVILCISTAAYRQLFGAEDRTGLIS